ncbi:hypothetical protein [Leptospira interrogans]|nr:hypothetical protein [Leptospira interrogans]
MGILKRFMSSSTPLRVKGVISDGSRVKRGEKGCLVRNGARGC